MSGYNKQHAGEHRNTRTGTCLMEHCVHSMCARARVVLINAIGGMVHRVPQIRGAVRKMRWSPNCRKIKGKFVETL